MDAFQFHPVIARWFNENYGSPTEPQAQGWPAIQSGKHTLIAAPTGSGKTLAAFMAALDHLFREGLAGRLRDETHVLYVSPLKALSNDIHKNLEEPLAGIRAALLAAEGRRIEVRAEVRTGDTSSSKRQAIARRPPHILVTTPESLYLLLTSHSGRRLLSTVRTLIVDEIHAVAGNRRGSHLALSMERLAALTGRPLQRIGLSATQKPLELVAKFLVGAGDSNFPSPLAPLPEKAVNSDCVVIDCGYARKMNLAIEIPGAPLEAVMSNEVWTEIYGRLAELIREHRTTLIFVNTRRLAERVTHHLTALLGSGAVTSHHGSLSARLRLEAEGRLKRGELKALVATASLELGIDIGSVDLVCQVGPTRSIATLLQRVGRARHQREGVPKGRIFPLSRDELVECIATVRSVREGKLDALHIPEKPLDVLAQQIVACASVEDCEEEGLYQLARRSWPYRELPREEFGEVVRMLAEGFSTRRGRRGALIHYDAVNHRIRARRGARLVALTSGGAIPDNSDYRVVLEPGETFIGTVNEDFAVESVAGDIFQLGNASWRILRINAGTVRVQDAEGQPPNIPFWLGEAPGRTTELSKAISDLRLEVEAILQPRLKFAAREERAGEGGTSDVVAEANGSTEPGSPIAWDQAKLAVVRFLCSLQVPILAAQQLADYFLAAYKVLGAIPSQEKLIIERFFDESGGMQLVVHSPFGIRINRAWGLALRKRFCRSFNFELQAAATDEAIVLSLGPQHSFALDEVFRYLKSSTVRDLLVQALLDAPMFPIRWRWNAGRALALPRLRGSRRIPPQIQRMESENLLAAVFPDQLACLENIVGDREIPEHPLVRQTIDDCLTEAMDIDGLIGILRRIESGTIKCVARDLPEPSPLAHEIINARVYAFLDNAPLEERRTQAVHTRRASDSGDTLGILDPAAIEKVRAEAWPRASNLDELHEALLLANAMRPEELDRVAPNSHTWLQELAAQKRACEISIGPRQEPFWAAAERLPLLETIYPGAKLKPRISAPDSELKNEWDRSAAIRELVRGRLEISGPVTARELGDLLGLPDTEVDSALLALESEGFLLRGKFRPGATGLEWCDRRLLARIHRLTINRLRAEIQPVSMADFLRFLLRWQHVGSGNQAKGPEGLLGIIEMLDGYEAPAGAWEPEILAARVEAYSPQSLDQVSFRGQAGWGRLSLPQNQTNRPFTPIRSSPVALFAREHLGYWLDLAHAPAVPDFSPDTNRVFEALLQRGALFFGEITKTRGLLPSRVEQALAELAAQGWVTSDSFEGLRALLTPPDKRIPFADTGRRRHHKAITSLEFAGRWSFLRIPFGKNVSQSSSAEPGVISTGPGQPEESEISSLARRERAIEAFARVLLRRYGVVFRRLLERESLPVTWFELGRAYRRLEAQGEIRGGYFVGGVSGEQFALPEAVGLLRSIRKEAANGEFVTISGADPLNLAGILVPGARIAAITSNRILFRDGVPVAALESDQVTLFDGHSQELDRIAERALRVGVMSASLRPYYA